MLNSGEEWLWDAVNAAINVEFNSLWDFELREPVGAERQPIVEAAVRSLTDYPRRPTSPSPDSQSFNHLKSVLALAPVHGLENPDKRVSIECTPGRGDIKFVSWNLSYTGEVHAALIKIMKEHGLVGWQQARWLVYDKVRKIIRISLSPILMTSYISMSLATLAKLFAGALSRKSGCGVIPRDSGYSPVSKTPHLHPRNSPRIFRNWRQLAP